LDWLALGKALSDIGGWAAFLALAVLILIGGFRRWWVWGWMYDRTESRAERAEVQAERNAASIESQTRAFEVMAKTYDRLERDVDRLASGRVNRE